MKIEPGSAVKNTCPRCGGRVIVDREHERRSDDMTEREPFQKATCSGCGEWFNYDPESGVLWKRS